MLREVDGRQRGQLMLTGHKELSEGYLFPCDYGVEHSPQDNPVLRGQPKGVKQSVLQGRPELIWFTNPR